jgi:predicted RNA-binding Zn-ribbon protein involved in translation (DUF1610 family)
MDVDQREELTRTFAPLRNMPTRRNLNIIQKRRLRKFKRNYAFQDPMGTRALIYGLASHINHACPDCAQAIFLVEAKNPHEITVRLQKNVRADEEIFIHYGKSRLNFDCPLCDTGKPIWKRWKRKNTKELAVGFKRFIAKVDPRKISRSSK